MTAEIKFRAWHTTHKIMLYPPLGGDSKVVARQGSPNGQAARILNGTSTQCFPAMMTWDGRCYVNGIFQPLVWMQYTGLRDRIGTEIYDGDICDLVILEKERYWPLMSRTVTISKRYGAWGFCHTHLEACHPDDREWRSFWDSDDREESGTRYIEVIGNIYQNPELLESQEKP